MVPRPVRAPTSRPPRTPRASAVAAARGTVPDVEDGPGTSVDRPARAARPVLALLRRPRDRPRRDHDGRHDAAPPLGGDPPAEFRGPRKPAVALTVAVPPPDQ